MLSFVLIKDILEIDDSKEKRNKENGSPVGVITAAIIKMLINISFLLPIKYLDEIKPFIIRKATTIGNWKNKPIKNINLNKNCI